MLSAEQVVDALGSRSVNRRGRASALRKDSRIVGLEVSGRTLYPAFQSTGPGPGCTRSLSRATCCWMRPTTRGGCPLAAGWPTAGRRPTSPSPGRLDGARVDHRHSTAEVPSLDAEPTLTDAAWALSTPGPRGHHAARHPAPVHLSRAADRGDRDPSAALPPAAQGPPDPATLTVAEVTRLTPRTSARPAGSHRCPPGACAPGPTAGRVRKYCSAYRVDADLAPVAGNGTVLAAWRPRSTGLCPLCRRPSPGHCGRWKGQIMTRVLVAYATKMGGTAGIAEAITDEMRSCGLTVDLRNAGDAPAAEDYDAVVVGSALYTGRWRRSAIALLRRLARRGIRPGCGCFTAGRRARFARRIGAAAEEGGRTRDTARRRPAGDVRRADRERDCEGLHRAEDGAGRPGR